MVAAPAGVITSIAAAVAAAAAVTARLMACTGPVRRRGRGDRPGRVGWQLRAARASR